MNLNELPGAELILPGLADLRHGQNHTVGALLVAIAYTRLTQAGLVIPKDHLAPEPELRLYAHLQQDWEDAYGTYNALINRLNSFCNSLECSPKLDFQPWMDRDSMAAVSLLSQAARPVQADQPP
ncbi:hypothetical protein [Leptolyngbya sp. PCC 6406]|uniref:hypothetical protein n=1 Tax=Leptolyngbya sp. PCC 6406 TaxID=1173264 RepID=UPI0002AC561C|nr:hypothetical protein [Leptolyngbya sp. PCC 6406]